MRKPLRGHNVVTDRQNNDPVVNLLIAIIERAHLDANMRVSPGPRKNFHLPTAQEQWEARQFLQSLGVRLADVQEQN